MGSNQDISGCSNPIVSAGLTKVIKEVPDESNLKDPSPLAVFRSGQA
jgi:hypothetical protein